ncbi:LacI family DNA-binding transcriptional regulator [Pontiella agarivorans]|uniref:LacI family DNA-binding transcriptional regulator n=1 Tax=Pontiella agarivorans TaxID=3038953 RepID=A0ABU5N1P9_9BACT|nr:LacI family DNA-binding transcriptional regulator [Pontiella agarivorans]MDZ8120323.1 LacI family DNA-binding transcriptional regulator [Pontiella agarivorans]
MSKQITIRDIAEKTGFSFQTVSRVLNGKAHLHKAATVRKIEKVANEMGYVPNLFAKGMQSGKTYSVGLIIDPFVDNFTEEIFRGAHDELMKRNYLPILLMHNQDGEDEQLVQRLAERRVEGLIIRPYPERMDEVSESIEQHHMPVVSVDYALTSEKKFDFVGTADEHGGQLAAEHLLELGHRRVAMLYTDTESLKLRKRGFEYAVSRMADAAEPVMLEGWNFEDDEKNQARIRDILTGENAVTGIFAGGDFMLPSVYRAAHSLNMPIPEELSVIGFGDEEFSEYMIPPATTLHQDAYEIGVQAAQLVIDRIENKDRQMPVRQMRFEPHLLTRESTAAPKA